MLGMGERIDIRAERQVYKNSIDIIVFVDGPDEDKVGIARPLTFEKVDRFMAYGDPTMSLRPDAAQQLMDELWRCGLRPTEGTGSAGALVATQRHLEDMRKIAFDTLAIVPFDSKKP